MKKDLLNQMAQECKTMDAAKKQDLLNKRAQNKTMDASMKHEILETKTKIFQQ